MQPDFSQILANIEREIKDIKTSQVITGDGWVLFRSIQSFGFDNTKVYKVQFLPDNNADYVAELKIVDTSSFLQQYNPGYIFAAGSSKGVWYIRDDSPFPAPIAPYEAHVFSTVPGKSIIEELE